MAKQFLDLTGLSKVWEQIDKLFQRKLVSGTNIKSINGKSILGAGNIDTPNTTYNQATADTLGLVKIGATGLGSKQYAVQLNGNGQMFVDLPWSAGVSADEKVKQLAQKQMDYDWESGRTWASLLTSYTCTTGDQNNEETNFVRKTPLLYNPGKGYLLLDEDVFGGGMALIVGKRTENNQSYDETKSTVINSNGISIHNKNVEIDEALTEDEINKILV